MPQHESDSLADSCSLERLIPDEVQQGDALGGETLKLHRVCSTIGYGFTNRYICAVWSRQAGKGRVNAS